MRDIKFKVKIKLNEAGSEFYEEESLFIEKKVHDVKSIHLELAFNLCIPDESEESVITIFKEYCEVFELMQFTGLVDKNGMDIYEGDIVKIDVNNEYEDDETFVGAVIFGRNGKAVSKNFVTDYPCSFTLFVKEWYHEEGLLGNSFHEYEIIGNIHSNPELLNNKS